VTDHRLGGQSMANGILGTELFAALRFWAGAPLGVAAVGFDLSKRSHVAVPGNWVRFAHPRLAEHQNQPAPHASAECFQRAA